MKLCKMCQAPLSGRRRVFCSDACYLADKTLKLRAKYQSRPEYARQKNAYSRWWSKAHPEQRRASEKRRRLAAVLQRVDAGRSS